jgi:hypothetical protein
MFFKNRIAFIPPLAEAGVFCDDYDKLIVFGITVSAASCRFTVL